MKFMSQLSSSVTDQLHTSFKTMTNLTRKVPQTFKNMTDKDLEVFTLEGSNPTEVKISSISSTYYLAALLRHSRVGRVRQYISFVEIRHAFQHTDFLFQKEICQHRKSNHSFQTVTWAG